MLRNHTNGRRRRAVGGCFAVLLVGGGIAAGVELTSPAQSHAVRAVVPGATNSSPPATAAPCAPNAPSDVQANCSQERSQADARAQSQMPADTAPGQSYITKDQAISRARGNSSAPSFAEMTRYADAAALIGEEPNASLSPTTQVWVVTVDQAPDLANFPQPGGAPLDASRMAGYTVIMDAVNGNVIDSCGGCTPLHQ